MRISGLYVLAPILVAASLIAHVSAGKEEATPLPVCNAYALKSWERLSRRVRYIASNFFKYDKATWNYEGVVNPIEEIRYSRLAEKHQKTEWGFFRKLKKKVVAKQLPLLGYPDAPCWDHHVNGYSGYTWTELQDEKNIHGHKLVRLVKQLGWTKRSWNGKDDPPDTDCMVWNELTNIQKKGAKGLGWKGWEWNSYPCSAYCSALYPEECKWVPPVEDVEEIVLMNENNLPDESEEQQPDDVHAEE